MTNFVTTKRALLTSVLSLVLCFAMLLGTTFAWFTDTVTSSGNVIQTGDLKVKMEWEEGNVVVADSVWKDASQGPIFNNKLWEPGRIEAKHIKITNIGTLALKYELNIVPHGTVSELADVIDVYYFADATQLDRSIATNGIRLGTLAELLNPGTSENPNDNHISKLINGKLDENGDWDDFTIALKMQESAGNEYQNLSIGSSFSIQLLATQATYEDDSFDNTYDADATYPVVGFGSSSDEDGDGYHEIPLRNPNGGKIGSVTLPVAAVDNGGAPAFASVTESGLPPVGVSVGADTDARVFNINIVDLVENNTDDIKVHLNVGKGLTGVSMYSGTTPINACAYSPYTGVVIFTATDVSLVTMVYDAVPTAGTFDPELPVAIVEDQDQYEDVVIDWESFGPFSELSSDYKLETVYKFTDANLNNPDWINNTKYADWICDYYVSCDKEVGAESIMLGGNYGEFGWVGFTNGGDVIAANTEIALLQLAAGAWTYEAVYDFVGEFLCGVSHLDASLNGANFTVILRIVNPENDAEFYDIQTVVYTFDDTPVVINP